MSEPVKQPTVKVYFIEPVKTISVVINLLIRMNFEVYSVSNEDKFKLFSVLSGNKRNVIFLCIQTDSEAPDCVHYLESVMGLHDSQNQVGVFVSSIIGYDIRRIFLMQGVATIDLYHLKSKPLDTLKKVLVYFDAREKRAFVKARAMGICQVFFTMKNLMEPVKAEIVDISVYAFTCKLEEQDKVFFSHKEYIPEVTLILRGRRIRVSARLMGFDRQNPDVGIFLIYCTTVENGQMEFHQKLNNDVKNPLYEYIESYLREDLKRRLGEFPSADLK
ncbi:MAG: hypothetical protein EHM28_07185 [Spirochaetaceae bacterium]|nr:MAG: hypothetical protein EHM28_07185 [Spirochaetaceae bacterium]